MKLKEFPSFVLENVGAFAEAWRTAPREYMEEGMRIWSGGPQDLKRLKLRFKEAVQRDRYLILRFASTVRQRSGEDDTATYSVCIDQRKRRVVRGDSDDILFEVPELGYAALGTMLVTAPVLGSLIAVLLARRALYHVREEYTGIDRHAQELYDAVKRTLPAMFRDELLEALRNMRAHERLQRSRVTFDDAKRLLLRATRLELAADDFWIWYDTDGFTAEDAVADATRRGEECKVRVRGTTFEGTDAAALLLCHRCAQDRHGEKTCDEDEPQ
ncbi:MAG: hypothetical protein RLZZ324_720 [Candidatus Parcubacteria bacterium]|jgi:hypothetical protein